MALYEKFNERNMRIATVFQGRYNGQNVQVSLTISGGHALAWLAAVNKHFSTLPYDATGEASVSALLGPLQPYMTFTSPQARVLSGFTTRIDVDGELSPLAAPPEALLEEGQ